VNSLRIETAYRDWSHDIGPTDTPLEAGSGFTCAWNKDGGFLGRDALLAQRDRGLLPRRLVQFLLSDPETLLYRYEPIYRDGARVGFVSSAMYGHTLGGAVGLGYVEHADGCSDEFVVSGRYEIQLPDGRVAAHASLTPLYDPKSVRVRA
jgi:4-methylaminobutanoate oxidase (formaldehyde-forming)